MRKEFILLQGMELSRRERGISEKMQVTITLKNEEGFFHSAKEKAGIQTAKTQNPDSAEETACRTVVPTKGLKGGNCRDSVRLFKDNSGLGGIGDDCEAISQAK